MVEVAEKVRIAAGLGDAPAVFTPADEEPIKLD
jgi:hypothetical protein